MYVKTSDVQLKPHMHQVVCSAINSLKVYEILISYKLEIVKYEFIQFLTDDSAVMRCRIFLVCLFLGFFWFFFLELWELCEMLQVLVWSWAAKFSLLFAQV